MNELNMAIYTGEADKNKVTLTAAFATHAEAVQFMKDLSALCVQHSAPAQTFKRSWRPLIGSGR